MQLTQLFDDDDAVSPVIGVILMVAITVILAAVIATFVLGLGDQVSDTAPQASFSTNWDGPAGGQDTLNVSHSGGDTVQAQTLYFRGNKGANSDDSTCSASPNVGLGQSWDNYDEQISGTDYDPTSEISAGVRAKIPCVGSDGEIDVVWQPQSGDNSATLKTWTGPDA